MLKNCSKCEVLVEFADDYPSRRGYWCKPCKSAYNVDSARRNRETKRKNNNAYHSRISAKRAEATAKWRASHPEKRIAHQAVQTAVRNGSLKKKPCEVCGSTVRIHAHHDNYEKKLDVIWVCQTHHMERHAMLEARK
jgi:hypothetical protein